MVDGETVRAAMQLLDELSASFAEQDWSEAGRACVVAFDPEAGTLSVHGEFGSRDEAQSWAEKFEADLNSGNGPGDAPFVCKAYPLWKPDPR